MSEIIQKQSEQAVISNYGGNNGFGMIGQIEEMGEALEESGQVHMGPKF